MPGNSEGVEILGKGLGHAVSLHPCCGSFPTAAKCRSGQDFGSASTSVKADDLQRSSPQIASWHSWGESAKKLARVSRGGCPFSWDCLRLPPRPEAGV